MEEEKKVTKIKKYPRKRSKLKTAAMIVGIVFFWEVTAIMILGCIALFLGNPYI